MMWSIIYPLYGILYLRIYYVYLIELVKEKGIYETEDG